MDADFSKELRAPSKILTETKVERAQVIYFLPNM